MITRFADAFFFVAVLNPRDRAHALAKPLRPLREGAERLRVALRSGGVHGRHTPDRVVEADDSKVEDGGFMWLNQWHTRGSGACGRSRRIESR
jgi:hypothetical protein